MAASLLPRDRLPASLACPESGRVERDEAAWSWLHPQVTLIGVLQQQQAFRDDPHPKVSLVFLPDDEEQRLILHRIDGGSMSAEKLYVRVDASMRHDVALALGQGIGTWGDFQLMELLAERAEAEDTTLWEVARKFASVEVPQSTQGWRWHPWLGFAPA